MDVWDAVVARRSVREYASRPIEPEKLRRVLEAGRQAPSAKNMQEWKFIVVQDERLRGELMRAAKGQAFVGQAPVVIVACGTICDYRMTCGQLTYPIDVAIALDHMSLVAVEEGLGTCWVGAFYQDQVRDLLGVPESAQVVSLMTLGYPSSDAAPEKNRKPFDEVVSEDAWS